MVGARCMSTDRATGQTFERGEPERLREENQSQRAEIQRLQEQLNARGSARPEVPGNRSQGDSDFPWVPSTYTPPTGLVSGVPSFCFSLCFRLSKLINHRSGF